MLVLRSLEVRRGVLYAAIGAAMWVAVYESGVEPVIVGLAMGLLTYAYPATRLDLERATNLFRSFREQPTPELARTAQRSLVLSVSPNERLQNLWHPWTSYVIVPLFALANAGIPISRTLLRSSFTSAVTLGIIVGYVVGKPVGIAGATWILSRLRPGLRLPVGWAPLVSSGVVAGIGFTVSLLIASLAFEGEQLQEAKVGVLTAALAASLLGWLAFRIVRLLPVRFTTGTSERLVDLAVPVDSKRDHVRGSDDAPVTLVEYGDFECPYCGRAEPVVREVVEEFGDDLRYVFRHLPLADVHPNAQLAAEAAEAAAAQGKFWEMHDLLFEHQDALRPMDLVGYAGQLGLDVERFTDELRRRVYASRVAEDIDTADMSGVTGTPTFFINDRRHQGAYDIDTLTAAVRAALQRARLLCAGRSGFRGAEAQVRSAREESRGVHHGDPCEVSADRVAGGESAGRASGDEATDLDDDLEGGACCEREEEDAEHVARREAAEPRAENRGRPCDEREEGEATRAIGRAPPSATGAAMPSPSVTLWIMKPTIRNVPSCSSPKANELPIASPSPRLWTPMPIATRSASTMPPACCPPDRRRAREKVMPR